TALQVQPIQGVGMEVEAEFPPKELGVLLFKNINGVRIPEFPGGLQVDEIIDNVVKGIDIGLKMSVVVFQGQVHLEVLFAFQIGVPDLHPVGATVKPIGGKFR